MVMKVVVCSIILERWERISYLHYRLSTPISRKHITNINTRMQVRPRVKPTDNSRAYNVRIYNALMLRLLMQHQVRFRVKLSLRMMWHVMRVITSTGRTTRRYKLRVRRANRLVNSQHCKLVLQMSVWVSLMPTRIVRVLLLEWQQVRQSVWLVTRDTQAMVLCLYVMNSITQIVVKQQQTEIVQTSTGTDGNVPNRRNVQHFERLCRKYVRISFCCKLRSWLFKSDW